MKLLVVSHSSVRTVNRRIYAEIQRQTGCSLTMVVPRDWRDEFRNVVQDETELGFAGRVLHFPVRANGSIIFHLYRTCWTTFLRRERFDAVYVNHEPYALATAQVVWANSRSLRAPIGFYSCQNIAKRYPPPFSWLERMVHRRTQFAFPITSAVEEVLRSKGFQGQATVAPLPFDPDLYHPRSCEENLRRIPRQIGETVLGYAGRLIEAKGLRTLAAALRYLKALSWKLVVIGNGEFEPVFRQLLEEAGVLPRVDFVGFVAHTGTPAYLAAMDVLILPSETQRNWKEQFGRVITEALACETAVVGSSSGEIPRLILETEGGLCFPERDAEALAAALRRMIEAPDERRMMAAQGRTWVHRNLTTAKVAEKMAETIERAVERNTKIQELANA